MLHVFDSLKKNQFTRVTCSWIGLHCRKCLIHQKRTGSFNSLCKFYRAMFESAMCSSFTVWYSSATQRDKFRLQRVVRMAERIIGTDLPSLQDLHLSRVKKRAQRIVRDPLHPVFNLFRLLPSGRRYSLVKMRTTRFQNSFFFPVAIKTLNSTM